MVGLKIILERIIHFLNLYFQVGAIYITTSNTNPAQVFGGTWQRIEGRFLMGQGNYNNYTYPINGTGGSANKIIPYHRHNTGTLWSNGNSGSGAYTKSSSRKRMTRTTGATGSSTINANLPPYYAVYIWRRVA